MLCPTCRRQIGRSTTFCPRCGRSLNGAEGVFDLVLPDDTRVPLLERLTIGRAPDNTVQLSDPSVSRHHARITPARDSEHAPVLEDAASSYGTWLDGRRIEEGRPLRDGSQIRIGDEALRVERRRGASEAGRTVVVPPGDSLVVPAAGRAAELTSAAADVGERPRLRSGYALKRLAAEEGRRRWVLEDLRRGRFFRFSDDDAALLELLDGRRPLAELTAEAELRLGAAGPVRLARLLADLGSRGLLAGDDSRAGPEPGYRGVYRLFQPRELSWPGAGDLFDRLYRRGGWLLFTRPAVALLSLVAAVGVAVFAFLVAGRYGTPFVVARKIGLGGLVFVVGRFAVVAFHETAHGLAMASYGRRVRKAGLKLLFVFPYAYVDTSEAWFEPRQNRIVVSAAGPASDFVLGGAFSVGCLLAPPGPVRDVFFQLAFASYLGALFNLNPLLERDGYHILVDVLREPGLRRRAREQLARRLSGRESRADSSPVLARYALLSTAWMAGAVLFVAVLSVRYEAPLAAVVPEPLAWAFLAGLWAALLTPLALMIGGPLRARRRLA
jgi:putative peptide zinc metalloprotease protein